MLLLELQSQQEILSLESKYERREQEREKLLRIKHIRLVNEARSEPARSRPHLSRSKPDSASEMSCVMGVQLKSYSAQEVRCDK